MKPNPLLVAINAACEIIEIADSKNLANDGPAGGFPPQMDLREWRKLYVTLDVARRSHATPERKRCLSRSRS